MSERRRKIAPYVEVNRDVGFGRPIVLGMGVHTSIIYQRHEHGELMDVIAEDYGISRSDVVAAIHFEAGRRWADGGRAKWNKTAAHGRQAGGLEDDR